MQVRLVEQARAGDHAAFRALVDLESHHCYAIAYRVIRDAERAQDAVQQAFLSAWRDLPQLRDPDRFRPWLYRLLLRACYVEAGRARGWNSRVQPVDVERPSGAEDFTTAIADRDAIDRAFLRLSPEHRAVMVLHHYADLPLAAVADAVGSPVGTVKSRLHYAANVLRAALEADSRVPLPGERPA